MRRASAYTGCHECLPGALAHCHHLDAAAADRLNIRPVYVPTKLTFLLQPLDEVVLKQALLAAEDVDGTVPPGKWASTMSAFWRARAWLTSFEACGFYPTGERMTSDLRNLKRGQRRRLD